MLKKSRILFVLLVMSLPAVSPLRADDKKTADKTAPRKKHAVGQRPRENDAQYAKRLALLTRQAEKDSDGMFTLTKGCKPFIVRTDISAEFTALTALYMEMLHRDYKTAYSKMGLPAGSAKELIEVVVYSSPATYLANSGRPGSGGQFMQAIGFKDRLPNWPVKHYRLMMFTNGRNNFDKWEKGTLKHEAAHMELQLRLGFAVDTPLWFNEGQATCFEYWDFDKSVDENLRLIPTRGRYAPVIRRLYETKKFQPFSYVWDIDPASWAAAMTDEQGGLNYSQAWSLAAFMLNGGKEGKQAFRTVYGLSKRVGADHAVSRTGARTLAWQQAFPKDDQKKMEDQWRAWIVKNIPHDGRNKDESEGLLAMGYDPREKNLVHFTKETYEKFLAENKKSGKDKKKKTDDADSDEEKAAAPDDKSNSGEKPADE